MGWQNVEVPATKIVFQSGDEMRCSNDTAFLVGGQSKKSKDLVAGDQVGKIGIVRSIVPDGEMLYFLNIEDEEEEVDYLKFGFKPPSMSLVEYIEVMSESYAKNCADAMRAGFQPMETGWSKPEFWRQRLIEVFANELNAGL